MAYNRKDKIVDNNKKRTGVKLVVILFIVIFLAASVSVALFLWVVPKKESAEKAGLGYDENAVVVTDEDALQKMVDEMQNREGSISLEYKNVAGSGDGTNFSCYIANSAKNKHDMYIGIYSDATYAEELYLSQLLRPGSGIKKFECNKKLEPGSYNVILVFTLVGDDHETIQSQTPVTYTLNVTESNTPQ